MRKEPTQEYLKECFDYVDGKLIWKERPIEHFSTERGWNHFKKYLRKSAGWNDYNKHINGYYRKIDISSIGRGFRRSRLVYIYHYGDIPAGLFVDHIDGDTLNDRIENRYTTYEFTKY